MKNRKEVRQKGYYKSKKTIFHERGENIIFGLGRGEKYIFLTKI
jgi:hypothetical protein